MRIIYILNIYIYFSIFFYLFRLESLDLSFNTITEDGAIQLLPALSPLSEHRNTTLKWFKLTTVHDFYKFIFLNFTIIFLLVKIFFFILIFSDIY